jgi:hypothetical protein
MKNKFSNPFGVMLQLFGLPPKICTGSVIGGEAADQLALCGFGQESFVTGSDFFHARQ